MFDLSALDAELDSLGRAPENASSLARSYAGIALSGPLSAQLEQVDAELSALSNGEYQAPVVVPHAPATARFDSALSGVVPVAPVESARAGAAHDDVLLARGTARFDEFDDELDPVPTLMPNFAAPSTESVEPAAADPMPASDLQELLERGPERFYDDSLTPLGEQSGAFANLAPPRSPSLTESQEIVLPDPIAREELSSESGELSLDGGDPESGSFALPDSPTNPRIVSEDMSARAPVTTEQLLPFDDVQDALEGSQPIAVSGRATQSPKAELDRDPDAEFDALLSEATDPRGMPTHGGSSEFDTDDLLRGLEGGDDETPDTEDVTQNDPHEAEMLTRSLYESGDDNTDVLDRATLGELERAERQEQERTQPEPQPESEDTDADLSSLLSPDELDSGELEIIDDEPTLAPQPTPIKPNPLASMPVPPPSARPGLSNKAPPPPPPSSSPDKRPSLLGRLFTKREGE